jgi:tetratricopeptide (TPR) repeat protein
MLRWIPTPIASLMAPIGVHRSRSVTTEKGAPRSLPILLLLGAVCVCGQNQNASRCDESAKASELERSAREAMQKHQLEAAVTGFQAAYSACPGELALLLELGNAYFMGQHLSEAKGIALQVLQSDPKNVAALEMKANSEYLLGDSAAAINTFIELLDRHPESVAAAYMLGRIYYQEGQVDAAIGQFERVLRLRADSYKAYDNLGLCYEAKGDDPKATHYFLAAIKLVQQDHSEYDTAYGDLSELLLRTGDNQKAFDAASMAAKRNPASARNFYLGGKALDQLGKTDLSLNWLQRSVALDPNYLQPLYVLARVYHKLGQEQKSLETRQKFLALQAKMPDKQR